MKEPIIKDKVMRYIRQDLRGGPAFGIVLLEQAKRFGCAASTLDTRLRQLRGDGFLSRERNLMAGGSKKRYVSYRCSAEQYHAWLVDRAAARATTHTRGLERRDAGAPPPAARAEAPGRLFDNSFKVHGQDVGRRSA